MIESSGKGRVHRKNWGGRGEGRGEEGGRGGGGQRWTLYLGVI